MPKNPWRRCGVLSDFQNYGALDACTTNRGPSSTVAFVQAKARGVSMNRWRSLGLLLVCRQSPAALAATHCSRAQFTAGPLVFRDFDIVYLNPTSCCGRWPFTRLFGDISVVPLDVGGFTLASNWEASERFVGAHLTMTFTAATTVAAPIGDFIFSVQTWLFYGNVGAKFPCRWGMTRLGRTPTCSPRRTHPTRSRTSHRR